MTEERSAPSRKETLIQEWRERLTAGEKLPVGHIDKLCDMALRSIRSETDRALIDAAEEAATLISDMQPHPGSNHARVLLKLDRALKIKALAPGERKSGEIAGPRNDTAVTVRDRASQEQAQPAEGTNTQGGDKRDGLTRERIEEFRREYEIPDMDNDGNPREPWAIEENRVLNAICEAALASIESANRRPEIPAELFDGMAVYVALGEKSGVSHRDVAAVLDAVVRLIRANRG